MTALMWFRSDLRADDNTALHHALSDRANVAAVFYATPQQWAEHDMAPAKGEFLWRTLAALRDTLARLNVPLLVRCVPDFAAIETDLIPLARELNCETVFANREYPIDELRRDRAVAAALAAANIGWRCFDDATLLAPGSVRTRQGQPFRVFTPFRRALLELVGAGEIGCMPIEREARPWFAAPELPAYPYAASAVDPALWPAGENAAAGRLREFIGRRIDDYARRRDFPSADGTSLLSPYLALGVISVRRCVEAALRASGGPLCASGGEWSGDGGPAVWLNELLWREFYLHVLAQFPQVGMYKPMRPETERVAWRRDEKDFAAWCEGRTGYPLVDAAMRQLAQTGWMHNRLRMVAAMFLSKYLLLDWRLGERHFMRHLIDGDLAANNGGWQWSASTGTDAAPYFRLLSPQRQFERFDAAAQFCRRFVPELRALDASIIAQPGHPELLRAGYPAPIVDLKFARERALRAFADAQTRG